MRNLGKIGWQLAFSAFFLLLVSIPLNAGPVLLPEPYSVCPSPNPTITERSSSSVSFSWDAVSGALNYKVWYYREGDNFTSPEYTTGSTNITFSGLPSGQYHFYFVTVCTGGVSDYIIIDLLI